MARNYSSNAVAMQLTGSMTGVTTIASVNVVTGIPATPFTIIVDRDTGSEEVMEVTSVAGLNLTVTRGVDGTAATSHSVGATVVHGFSARDLREPAQHIDATTNIHGVGVGASVVGTTTTQTLSAKTFQAPSDVSAVDVKAASPQTNPMMRFLSNAGAVLASISGIGRVATPGVDGSNTSTFTAGASGTKALIAKGAASQSVSVFEVQNSGATPVVTASAAGDVVMNGALTSGAVTATGANSFTGTAIGQIVAKIKGFAGHTANLLEVQDSAAAVKFSVSPAGIVTTSGALNAGGAVTTGGNLTVNGGSGTISANLDSYLPSVVTVTASGDVALSTGAQDVPGATLPVTGPASGSVTLLIWATFDMDCTAFVSQNLSRGWVDLDGATQSPFAVFGNTAAGQRATITQVYAVAIGPGAHTVKLRADRTTAANTLFCRGANTTLSILKMKG